MVPGRFLALTSVNQMEWMTHAEAQYAHVMRNEIVASKQKSESMSFELSLGRREERAKEGKREKHHRTCLAKSVTHRKRGGENEQTDPLDGRTQVEDELRRARAVSSSDAQIQSLGKRR